MFFQTGAVVILLLCSCVSANDDIIKPFSCYVCTGCPRFSPMVKMSCENTTQQSTLEQNPVTLPAVKEISDETSEELTEIVDDTDDPEVSNNQTTVAPRKEYACYEKYSTKSHELIWERGCIKLDVAKSYCDNNTDAKVCKVCYDPNCNGSAKLAISTVFTIFLAFFVYKY